MTAVVYSPLEEYDKKYRQLHEEKTNQFLEELVQRSGVDIAQNRTTVAQYQDCLENVGKLRRKRNWLRFFRVLMIITIVLIPLVILKMTPVIRTLKAQIEEADKEAARLLALAEEQMRPLNCLFTEKDALHLIEETIPLIKFENAFSAEQETDMKVNYDFFDTDSNEQSTVDVLAGHYNENPFLFEKKRIHTMGVETYHGYRTIYWTETYRDSNGKLQTRTRSQTLHATVVKPKPYYSDQVVLSYCAQGGPELCFSRDATHLERKSEKEIERYVKKGEKKLKKLTDEAIRSDSDFQSMSNSDFEVLFDALDRNNEVQFRTLFTPLAQTNMVDLIRSDVGYGDDFNFIKRNRTNRIITQHSQGRSLNLMPQQYVSYSFDIIKQNFVGKNCVFFKDVYFDFAPALAIPMYQERPVHSLKPIPPLSRMYSQKESEMLANAMHPGCVVHPDTKTPAILKSSFVRSQNNIDETCIIAYSYDIAKRVDVIPVYGGDGKFHSVPVEWDEYLPLMAQNFFNIAASDMTPNQSAMANRNGICIFHSNR